MIHYFNIPSPPLPNFRISVGLEGTTYIFDFRWNVRDAAWYMDVYDALEAPIRRGIRMVLGTFLGRTCNDPPFSNGAFVLHDTSGADRDATMADLGTRVRLAYLPAQDLVASLAAANVGVVPK